MSWVLFLHWTGIIFLSCMQPLVFVTQTNMSMFHFGGRLVKKIQNIKILFMQVSRQTLLMRTEIVHKMSVIFNQLTRLKAREDFISFSRRASFISPPRRPRFKPGSGHVGFCDGQKWRWGRFSPRTSVSPPNLHSICFSTIIFISPEAGTTGQEWPQCQ
jgi:hypothetical protein